MKSKIILALFPILCLLIIVCSVPNNPFNVPPQFILNKSIVVNCGDTIDTLLISSVSRQFDSIRITPSFPDSIQFDKSTLTVKGKACHTLDSTLYTVEATNTWGSLVDSFYLVVNPPAVSSVWTKSFGIDSVEVMWGESEHAEEYYVYRSIGTSVRDTLLAVVNYTSYMDRSTLTSDSMYYYHIRARSLMTGLSHPTKTWLIVKALNDTPQVSGLVDQTVNEDDLFNTINLNTKVLDKVHSSKQITWSITNDKFLNAKIDSNNVVTISPLNPEWSGSERLIFTAKDPNGLADTQSVLFTIIQVNDPPIFISTPHLKVPSGAKYSYKVEVSDPEGTNVKVNFNALPNWLKMVQNNDGTLTIEGTSGKADSGDFNISLSASDGTLIAMQSFTLHVGSPRFTTKVDTIAKEDSLYSCFVKAIHEGDGKLYFGTETMPSWLTFQATDSGVRITGTPTNKDTGENRIVITVFDSISIVKKMEASIRVSNVNDPPAFISTPVTSVAEEALYSYSIIVSDSDNTFSQLIITGNNLPSWLKLSKLSDRWVLSGNPDDKDTGIQKVILKLTDEKLETPVEQLFSIVVVSVNDAPKIVKLPTDLATEHNAYSFQVQVEDPDDNTFSYTLMNAPSGMVITNSGLLTWTPGESVTSSGSVSLKVKDNGNPARWDSIAFAIGVAPVNDAPVITKLPGDSILEKSSFAFKVGVTDPDDSLFRFSLVNAPSGMTIDSNGGTIRWTPNSVSTSGVVKVLVFDTKVKHLGDSATFVIPVINVNDRPSIVSVPKDSATQLVPYSFKVKVTDPDDSLFAFSLISPPAGMSIDNNGLITWTPSATISNSGSVKVIVTDKGIPVLADTESFSIVVKVSGKLRLLDSISTPILLTSPNALGGLFAIRVYDHDDTISCKVSGVTNNAFSYNKIKTGDTTKFSFDYNGFCVEDTTILELSFYDKGVDTLKTKVKVISEIKEGKLIIRRTLVSQYLAKTVKDTIYYKLGCTKTVFPKFVVSSNGEQFLPKGWKIYSSSGVTVTNYGHGGMAGVVLNEPVGEIGECWEVKYNGISVYASCGDDHP